MLAAVIGEEERAVFIH